MGPRWRLLAGLCAGILFAASGLAEVASENEGKSQGVLLGTTPCWRTEDFVVTLQCAPCTSFQSKTMPECGVTGFVEQINCSASKKGEFKSCRSAAMESRLFWRFEGAMLGAAASFALLVVCRQRLLDRKALEKVRKQIESI
ncbi:protein JTB [Anolis carolinensis]|uniref:protein JTB n=1 Tax=Anolis carolinensis TaxID=28377 RepID=UPI002F2B23E9